MKTLLSPLKSVIPVTFTPIPGRFSWKFPPSPPFESTNKPAERPELFFFGWNGIKGPRRFWWVDPKLRNGLIGECLENSGPFESAKSDGIVWLLNWDSDETTNADKTSSILAFF